MRCFATASSLSVAQLVPMPAAQVKVTTREHGIDTNKMSMFVPEEAMRYWLDRNCLCGRRVPGTSFVDGILGRINGNQMPKPETCFAAVR
jgi:hypothetical protein